jgi:hypothetical protein
MWWWNGLYPMSGMGWVFPLVGLVFMIMVMFAVFHFFGGRSKLCGGRTYNEIEDLRREMRELKDEIAKLRKKE